MTLLRGTNPPVSGLLGLLCVKAGQFLSAAQPHFGAVIHQPQQRKNSCRTPSGATISPLPPARFRIRRKISSCCRVFPSPKASNSARRPPFTAHWTARRWNGFRLGWISGSSISNPSIGDVAILARKKARYRARRSARISIAAVKRVLPAPSPDSMRLPRTQSAHRIEDRSIPASQRSPRRFSATSPAAPASEYSAPDCLRTN